MWLAKRSLRPDVAGLQLAALTPMAVFLMASVNPNATEIAGFVAIWACMTRVATDTRSKSDALLILASLLSAVVVLMRPISIVWMAGTGRRRADRYRAHQRCGRCSPGERLRGRSGRQRSHSSCRGCGPCTRSSR